MNIFEATHTYADATKPKVQEDTPRLQLSEKQTQIATSFLRPEKILIFHGAIRTGKTKFGAYSFVDWILTKVPTARNKHDLTFAVIAWTYGNILETIEPYLIEHFERHKLKVERNGNTGVFVKVKMKYGTRSKTKKIFINYFGASDAKSFKKIQGQTLRGIFGDEVALLNRDAIETAMGRTITYADAKFYMTTNPEGGELHPFYVDYILDKDNYVIHLTMYDNPILDERNIEMVAKAFSQTMKARKVYGQWVISEGACYESQPIKIDKGSLPKFKYINIGVDEGRADAFTGVAIAYSNVTKAYYIVKQYYDKSDKKMIDNVWSIVDMAKELRKEYKTKIFIVAETNPGITYDTLRGLKKDKLPTGIYVEKVKKQVKHSDFKQAGAIQERIDVVNMMMNTEMLFVVENEATQFLSAMSNAVYGTDGKRLDNGTTDIDSLDAGEYALSTEIKSIYERSLKIINTA